MNDQNDPNHHSQIQAQPSMSANPTLPENNADPIILDNIDYSQIEPIDIETQLRFYRTKNLGKLIFSTLNINSLRNKFEEVKSLISGNIDVLVLNETKLDSSFPSEQFFIPGFSPPYRMDKTGNGGGTMIYVREDIPSKELTRHTLKENVEGIFIELNFRKYKLLVLGTYRPPNQDKQHYFNSISNSFP